MVVRVDPVAIAATSVFVGRQNELRVLDDAFGQASAGIRRSCWWRARPASARRRWSSAWCRELPATRVLRASGDESESHVPFAMADQLLRSDGRGSDALRAGRHVAVGLELLELISAGPTTRHASSSIDDAHLVDAESLRALLFAARRLLASRALVVLVVRGTAEDTLPGGMAQARRRFDRGALTLGPLAPSQISELGLALGVAMTPDAAGRLWEHTRRQPAVRPCGAPGAPGRRAAGSTSRVRCRYRSRMRSWCARSSTAVRATSSRWWRRQRCWAYVRRCTRSSSWPASRIRSRRWMPRSSSGLRARWTTAQAARSSSSRIRSRGPPSTKPCRRRGAPRSTPRAAGIVHDAVAAMRHRVEAATITNDALLADLEAHAHAEMSRGAWSSAVSSLIAASRLTPVPGRSRAARPGGDRGDAVLGRRGRGAAARRADGVRRRPPARQRAGLPGHVRRRSGGGRAAVDARLGTARARRRRPAVRDDRPAQRLPGHRSPARTRGDRVGAASHGARAGRSRHRTARGAVAGAGVQLHRLASGSACRARPLARGSGGAARTAPASSCSR